MRSGLLRLLGRSLLLTTVCAGAACSSGPGHTQRPVSAGASGPVQVPGCSTQVAAGPGLSERQPALVSVPGSPTGVAASPDGRWAFAALSQNGYGGDPRLAVLAVRTVADGRRLALVRVIKLPPPLTAAWGMSVSPDGRLLLVAGGSGTAVLSLSKVVSGAADPVLGVLSDGGPAAFEAAPSSNGHYAFVTDEASGDLYVFNLALALQRGFDASGVRVGAVPLASGAVGIATSPDGTLIYVTTYGQAGPYGRLWVIDAPEPSAPLAAARWSRARPPLPARPGGALGRRQVAWVTALQSNAVLAFDTATLRQHRSGALRAVVHVGSEPVGLVVVNGGSTILATDSDRGLVAPSSGLANVSVISTERRWPGGLPCLACFRPIVPA